MRNVVSFIKKQQGFTLIELLVGIVVIGIISSFVSINFNEVRKKARDSQRKTDVLQIQSAVEKYRGDMGAYPTSQPNNAQLNNTPCNQSFQANTITYLNKIPCDPLGTASNYNSGDYYYYSADGLSYTVGACLESKSDPQGQATPP